MANPALEDLAKLVRGKMAIRALQAACSKAGSALRITESYLDWVMREDCWRHWKVIEGDTFQWGAGEFRQFIETPSPRGCGGTVALARRALAGGPLVARFDELVSGEPSTPAPDAPAKVHPGILTNNWSVVRALQDTFGEMEARTADVVTSLEAVVSDSIWRRWVGDFDEFRWGEGDFGRFIESKRPSGCETPVWVVRWYLDGSPLLDQFESLVSGHESSSPRIYHS